MEREDTVVRAKPAAEYLPRYAKSRLRGDAAKVRLLLERDLLSDRWHSGERLPTERELSVQYRVARNTVRRALQALEDRRLIVRHVGRGTFRSDGLDTHIDPFEVSSEAFSPADVIECRLFFEPELVPLVIARATKADLDRMTECVRKADASGSLGEFERWDGALHDAIAAATHNHAAISIARSLARARQNAEWGILKARSMTPERQRQLQADHRAIVAALRDRDQARARSLLRKHLIHVRAYMFGDSASGQSLI
jgi:DNA-binding FadR family transcriptional regulator